MFSVLTRKITTGILVVALLNLMLFGMPVMGESMLEAHGSSTLQPTASADFPPCHEVDVELAKIHEAVPSTTCDECGESCTLCVQISLIIQFEGFESLSVPGLFLEESPAHLMSIRLDLLLPPPISPLQIA